MPNILKAKALSLPSMLTTASIITVMGIILPRMYKMVKKLPSLIYDNMILHMTEVWYQSVLTRVECDSSMIDVGIGTAGALLRCREILQSKRITVHGIDYNPFYIDSANASIKNQNLQNRITVQNLSVYDLNTAGKKYDCAYFSGSLSLMPDPAEALRTVSRVVKPGGMIYVTQTFQRRNVPFLSAIKPLIKFLTTVDFGQLVMEEEIIRLYQDCNDVVTVLEHKVISGSVDTVLQAAYLTVLEVRG